MLNFILSFTIGSLLLLSSCIRNTVTPDTGSLVGLKAMAGTNNKNLSKTKSSKIREMAIRETALSLGAQSGLAWEAKIIDNQLIMEARTLDAIFDFNSLLLEHNILPPVLLEGRHTFNLADTQTIRISDRVYKLAKQARFVSVPPTWRQYLWMDYTKPEMPHISLLPKGEKEKTLWCYYVAKGWQKGIEQADVILEESIARIKEDFAGMIMYRKLLAMNMVSAPFVSHTDLGITGDESELHIDDQVLRITALPVLNTNSNEWRAAVAKDETTLERLNNMERMLHDAKINISSKAWQPVIAPVNEELPH